MNKIYRFHIPCGRMGDLEGLFVADDLVVKRAVGMSMYFDEPLGKHSAVECDLEMSMLTVLSDDPDFVAQFVDTIGHGTISGLSPLDHIEEIIED